MWQKVASTPLQQGTNSARLPGVPAARSSSARGPTSGHSTTYSAGGSARRSPTKDAPLADLLPTAATSRMAMQQQQSLSGAPSHEGNFRSKIVGLEIALRELVADGPAHPPNFRRSIQVVKYMDQLIEALKATHHLEVEEVLQMLRVEFCRSMFERSVRHNVPMNATSASGGMATASNNNGGAGSTKSGKLFSSSHDSEWGVPYFDRVATVEKELAILTAELDTLDTSETTEELQKQLLKLKSSASFYEHEIQRLQKENGTLKEELSTMRKDHDVTVNGHIATMAALELHNSQLSRQVREMQLSILQLTKESREKLVSKHQYGAIKAEAVASYEKLFDSREEINTLQILMVQLEMRINAELEKYEETLLKHALGAGGGGGGTTGGGGHRGEGSSSAGGRHGGGSFAEDLNILRHKMIIKSSIPLLLDEYYEVNRRRNALLAFHLADSIVKTTKNGPAVPKTSGNDLSISMMTESELLQARLAAVTATQPAEMNHLIRSSVAAVTAKQQGFQWPNPSSVLEASGESAKSGKPTAQLAAKTKAAKAQAGKGVPTKFSPASLDLGKQLVDRWMCGDEGMDTVLFSNWEPKDALAGSLLHTLNAQSGDKFMGSYDVCIGSGPVGRNAASLGGELTHLRSVQCLDNPPLIELPPRSTQVRIRFANPMTRPSVLACGLEDASIKDRLKKPSKRIQESLQALLRTETNGGRRVKALPLLLKAEMLGDDALIDGFMGDNLRSAAGGIHASHDDDVDAAANMLASATYAGGTFGERSSPGKDGAMSPSDSSAGAAPGADGDRHQKVHWAMFKAQFFDYVPCAPRTLTPETVDLLMVHICLAQHAYYAAMADRAQLDAMSTAGGQSVKVTAERLLRERIQPMDFQKTMLNVLESLFQFPNIVMKVGYEFLDTLDVFVLGLMKAVALKEQEKRVRSEKIKKRMEIYASKGMTPPSVEEVELMVEGGEDDDAKPSKPSKSSDKSLPHLFAVGGDDDDDDFDEEALLKEAEEEEDEVFDGEGCGAALETMADIVELALERDQRAKQGKALRSDADRTESIRQRNIIRKKRAESRKQAQYGEYSTVHLVTHATIYLDTVAGYTSAHLSGILAQCHSFINRYWPVGVSAREEPISHKDMLSILKGLYPPDTPVRVSFEDVLLELELSCKGTAAAATASPPTQGSKLLASSSPTQPPSMSGGAGGRTPKTSAAVAPVDTLLTLQNVSQAFTAMIVTGREPIMAKLKTLIDTKCDVVQWQELDATQFWEAVRPVCSEDLQAAMVREHLVCSALYRKTNRLPVSDLVVIAADLIWTTMGQSRPK